MYSGFNVADLDELLDGVGFLELNLGDGSDSQEVLESVGNGVRGRSHSRVSNSQREGGNIGYSLLELGTQVLGLDVKDSRSKDGARVIDLQKF